MCGVVAGRLAGDEDEDENKVAAASKDVFGEALVGVAQWAVHFRGDRNLRYTRSNYALTLHRRLYS